MAATQRENLVTSGRRGRLLYAGSETAAQTVTDASGTHRRRTGFNPQMEKPPRLGRLLTSRLSYSVVDAVVELGRDRSRMSETIPHPIRA